MKINRAKLEIAMANACINTSELSKSAKVNYSTITRIKAGQDTLPVTVGKIAAALGVDVTEIIETE